MTFVNRHEGTGEGSWLPRFLGILSALEACAGLSGGFGGGGGWG